MAKQYRYPGAKPFTLDQQRIFFGRQHDVEELFQSVSINQVVTLFAKSGMGKSSLLNAGLAPKVRQETNLKMIPVRFGAKVAGKSLSPLQHVMEAVRDEYRSQTLEYIRPEQENSLWYHAKNRYHQPAEEPEGLFLVFDQFEELFTYSQEEIDAFGRQMSELLFTTIPDRFREKLEILLHEDEPELPEEELEWLHQPIDIRIVVAIRSDRMSLLNQLKPYIPNILENCFELKALNHEQAEDAILNPAFHPAEFVSPLFDYEDEAVENMIDFLSDKKSQNIESFQLQILCEHVERHIVIGQERRMIRKEDLARPEEILENYYLNKISEIPGKEERLAVRKLIEEGLVFEEEERRITLYEGQLKKVYGIHSRLLAQLLDTHLIRSEASMRGGYTYELSHDTLVAPVLRAKAKRLEKERKAAEEKERARRKAEVEALEEKAEKERRRAEKENALRVTAEENEQKARKLSRIAMWVTGLTILMAILTGWSYSRARKSAQTSMRQTINALSTNLAYKAQNVLEKGDRSTALRLATLAFKQLDSTNLNAAQLLGNSLYINDNPELDLSGQLPWSGKLIGHGSQLTAVVFASDGKTIFTAAADRTLRRWEPVSGRELSIHYFDNPLIALDCSADGRLLAGLEAGGMLRIWELNTMEEIKTIDTGEENGRELAFSPDGTLLATGSNQQHAKVWTVADGALLLTLQGHSQAVHGLAFSPDGQSLLTGSSDSTALLWDLPGGNLLRVFAGHTNKLADVAYSPGGEFVATGSLDNSVIIWNAQTGAQVHHLQGHEGYIESVRFSPDGKYLASGSWDATVKLWEVGTGQFIRTLVGHNGVISAVAFSPTGAYLASSATDNICRIWEVSPQTAAQTISGHTDIIESIEYSSDGSFLLTASRDQTAKIWDVAQLSEKLSLRGHSNRVIHAAWSPDDQFVATASYDSTARVWNAGTGEEILRLGHPNSVVGIDYAPDGSLLATACMDSMVRVFQLPGGELRYTLAGFEGPVTKVAFSPDGKLVAAGSRDLTAIIWSLTDGSMVHQLRGHGGPIEGIAFSPDGRSVATASWDQTVRLWEVAGGEMTQTLRGHRAFVISVAFSPDGKNLVSTGLDKTAILWDLEGNKPLFIFRGHRDFVIGVDYSPDGNMVATASRDRLIKLWKGKAGAFAAASNFVLYPGELDAGQLYDFEVIPTIETAAGGLDQFIRKANPHQLKALGHAYQRDAEDENRRRFINRNYEKSLACFTPLYAQLDSALVNFYLADLYVGWSRKLLSLGRWNNAIEKSDLAQALVPDMIKVQRHVALIDLIRAKDFSTAPLRLLQLDQKERLDVLDEVKLWRNYPSFFTNLEWQGYTEKLIRLLDPGIRADDERAFQQKYGIQELQYHDMDRETILSEISDPELRAYVRSKWE
jgi:WD40 repeat protein